MFPVCQHGFPVGDWMLTFVPSSGITPAMKKRVESELKGRRLKLGLTLQEVATACKCGRTAVWRWENRTSEPEPEFRAPYAKVLGLSVKGLGALIYRDSAGAK
jgi:DNA-binding XRE family transcriptional regulator